LQGYSEDNLSSAANLKHLVFKQQVEHSVWLGKLQSNFFGVGGKHDIGFGESSLSDNQILLLMGFPQVFKKKEKALFHSDSAFSEG